LRAHRFWKNYTLRKLEANLGRCLISILYLDMNVYM
jgi:hypothetical protein